MMALSGVRISWLTLARNSDFCALASSAARLDDSSSPSVFLNAVMSRRTAQNFRSGPSLTRPTVMNSGMMPPCRTRPRTAQPAFAGPQVELERAQPLALLGRRRPGDDHEARRQPIPLHRRQPDIARDAFVAAAGERQRRHALKSRRRPHSAAKQARHAALRRELPDVVVVDEVEENAVEEK